MDRDRPGTALSEQADPKKTYAVVVGIEEYASAAWNVTDGSPSTSATEFCGYLQEHGVEGQKTHLLLSALKDPGPVPGSPQIRGATRGDFSDVIDQLRGQTGELLVVYWCGHGVIDLDRGRRLFFADAEKDRPHNLELDPFLAVLASEWFPGFRRQLLLIDACATPMSWNFTFDVPGERFPPNKPLATSQAVLYSALHLESAKPGLLWRAVKPRLGEQLPERWPPDVGELVEQLNDDFEKLDADQRPGLHLTDWHGQRVYKTLASSSTSHLKRNEREQAAAIFGKAEVALDVLLRVYVAALPVPGMAMGDIHKFSECLAHVSSCDSPQPALALALGIAAEMKDGAVGAELESWAEAVAERLQVPDDRLAEIKVRFDHKEETATLLFQTIPEEDDEHSLQAWLWRGKTRENEPEYPREYAEDKTLSFAELEGVILQVVRRTRDRLPDECELVVELMVPLELMSKPFDAWVLRKKKLYKKLLGTSYPVVVRYLERTTDQVLADSWRPRWKKLKEDAAARVVERTRWIESADGVEQLYDDLVGSDDEIGIGLAFAPEDVDDWLDLFMVAGIPALLWLRKAPESAQAARKSLCEALDDATFADLPGSIYRARKLAQADPSDVRRHVSILWDDADRSPPRPSNLE